VRAVSTVKKQAIIFYRPTFCGCCCFQGRDYIMNVFFNGFLLFFLRTYIAMSYRVCSKKIIQYIAINQPPVVASNQVAACF